MYTRNVKRPIKMNLIMQRKKKYECFKERTWRTCILTNYSLAAVEFITILHGHRVQFKTCWSQLASRDAHDSRPERLDNEKVKGGRSYKFAGVFPSTCIYTYVCIMIKGHVTI